MTSAALGHWEVAARISSGKPRIVIAVVAKADEVATLCVELAADLKQLDNGAVHETVANEAHALEGAIAGATATTLIHGLDTLSDDAWRALDRARSRLQVRHFVVLVLDEPTAKRMAVAAPNLASWVADSFYRVEPHEPSDPIPDQRIAQFCARYEMTTDEAIRRAESREAPSTEPDFAVWLILLGRGDLVLRGEDDHTP